MNGPSNVETADIHELEDVLRISQSVLADFPNQPWWRGHASSFWDLVPHVFRDDVYQLTFETNALNRFVRLAPTRHLRCPAPGELWRWLFLAQHYGLPTRLLDWTESPLLAVYFAVREEEDEHAQKPGTIWAIDPFALNAPLLGGAPGLCQPGQVDAKALIELAFTGVTPMDQRVVALVTEEIDPRMMVQLSGMTIHGSRQPLNARSELQPLFRRFTIAGGAKPYLRRQLASLGIRERTVFPDLEHLAADLKRDRYPESWPR